MSESHREAFEGRAFNLYFLMSIEKNPKPPKGTGAMDYISTATMTQAELCKRDEKDEYVDVVMRQLWSGWQMALGCSRHLGDIAGKGDQAAYDVLAERMDQRRRWSVEHDDEHDQGDMAFAAASYAISAARNDYPTENQPLIWPWAPEWWKPRSPREDLVRAGALILAEIERLDRAAAQKPE